MERLRESNKNYGEKVKKMISNRHDAYSSRTINLRFDVQKTNKGLMRIKCDIIIYWPMSVRRDPPMTAGRDSAAHLVMAEKMRPKPVSFGFSSPRSARCFMTETNSLLDNLPSPFSSNKMKTTSMM